MPHIKKEMLSFFITTDCNLNCQYCFAQSMRGNETIPWEFAKLGVDFFVGKNKYTHIRFSGAGEPTTRFSLMKKIIEYAYSKINNLLSVELQTNGIFNDMIARWLAKNINIIWISCDGSPDIQNDNRPFRGKKTSSKILEKNIKYLTKYGKEMTGIRSTITINNLYRQNEMLEYFNELGIKYIWSDPIFPIVYGDKKIIKIDIMEYAKEFSNAQKTAERLNLTYGSILTCNFDGKTKYHCRACIPTPHLTTDGYISACDMALFGKKTPEHITVFIYGKWDRNNKTIIFDDEKIKQLRSRNVDNLISCINCEAKYNCGGYCPGEAVNEKKNLFAVKDEVCNSIRYLLKNYSPPEEGYKYLHP